MTIGIDKIGFYTTPLYLDLVDLAHARGVDPNKYLIGIGQEKQAVIPPSQDIVTMGASAAAQILSSDDRQAISTIIVATESGIDNSKAAAIYVKHLLGLGDFVRAIELKEACYSGTAAIQFARGLVSLNPDEKVLVIAADIARYGIGTAGEVTQGGGAVAILITSNPRVLAIDGPSVSYTQDVMDFWRPLYASEARVDGKYSTGVYIDFFQHAWGRYQNLTGQRLADFKALIFHLPFTKMGKKALDSVIEFTDEATASLLQEQLKASQVLSRQVGNLYSGSLYLALISLLMNGSNLRDGDRIGLFSYGSGAEGEFYTGILQDGFQQFISENQINQLLSNRQPVSVKEYERLFSGQLGMSPEEKLLDVSKDNEKYRLTGFQHEQRIYQVRK